MTLEDASVSALRLHGDGMSKIQCPDPYANIETQERAFCVVDKRTPIRELAEPKQPCSLDWEPDVVFGFATLDRSPTMWSWTCPCGRSDTRPNGTYKTPEAARGAWISHKYDLPPAPAAPMAAKRLVEPPNGTQTLSFAFVAAGCACLWVLPHPWNYWALIVGFLLTVVGIVRYA